MNGKPLEFTVRDRRFYATFAHNYEVVGKNKTSEAITTCIIRTYNPMLTISGVAVCNPNDVTVRRVGERVAFQRAVSQNMLKLLMCTGVRLLEACQFKNELWDAFRRARFEAENPDRAAELAAAAEDRKRSRERLAEFEAIYEVKAEKVTE